MTEYSCLLVNIYDVGKDDAKKRGWNDEGILAGVTHVLDSGRGGFTELAAVETGSGSYHWYPSWDFRWAVVGQLNKLASEGWRVVDFSPEVFNGETRPWPPGSFLLEKG